jgi:hypothetical protein
MLTKIISFFALKFGISTWIIELIMIGCTIGGAFWWLKVHDAKIYDAAHTDGVKFGIEQLRKEHEKDWAIVLKGIEMQKLESAQRVMELENLNKKLNIARDVLEKRLKDVKVKVVEKIVQIPIEVYKIPSDKLIDNIRVKSADLAGDNIKDVKPTGILIEPESRLVLTQLNELSVRRTQIIEYEDIIEKDRLNDAVQVQNCKIAVDNEVKNTKIMEKERDLAIEKAKFYENSYKIVIKKRSKKCWIFKIFTLGMAKCT